MLTGITTGLTLKAVGSFIRAYWLPIIVAILVGLVWWRIHSLKSNITKLQTDNASLSEQVASAKEDQKKIKGILDTQKQAFDQIKELQTKMDTDFKQLDVKYQTHQRQTTATIERIRRQKTPTTNNESVDYILSNVDDLRSNTK